MNTGMPVESPVRGDSHAGFGGRLAETERPKGRHRAAGRPYAATKALDEVRREHWNELRHAGETSAAKAVQGRPLVAAEEPRATSPTARPPPSPPSEPAAGRSPAPGR